MLCLHLSVFVTFVVLSLPATAAMKGCSSFGHSCFGGHGKRNDNLGEQGVLSGHFVDPGSQSLADDSFVYQDDARNDRLMDFFKKLVSSGRARNENLSRRMDQNLGNAPLFPEMT